MDVPDLVRQSLGDEEIQAGVSLGDDDAICFTPRDRSSTGARGS